MKTISLSRRQIEKLKEYRVDDRILNGEARFYVMNSNKFKKDTDRLLLKKLYITEGESLANKLFTVSLLSDREEELGIPELVIPKHLVSMNGNIIGFSVPEVRNTNNLGLLLRNPKIAKKEKLKYLKKVGETLNKIYKQDVVKFSIGDLHEFNILVDKESEDIHLIDVDSAYLDTNHPVQSYYFSNFRLLNNLKGLSNKYHLSKDPLLYASKNSDLLCYMFMILNTISNEKIQSIDTAEYYNNITYLESIDTAEYYNYITYLESIGYNKDILESFRAIYSMQDNINPVDFLDDLSEETLDRSSYKVYQANRK